MVSVHPHLSSRGRARWVGGRRWRLSRRRQSIWVNNLYFFFRSIIVGFSISLGMLVAKWVPTPCYNDAYSVGTPKWALWGKS